MDCIEARLKAEEAASEAVGGKLLPVTGTEVRAKAAGGFKWAVAAEGQVGCLGAREGCGEEWLVGCVVGLRCAQPVCVHAALEGGWGLWQSERCWLLEAWVGRHQGVSPMGCSCCRCLIGSALGRHRPRLWERGRCCCCRSGCMRAQRI
eukprot:scaffold119472_cov21-Tisochrysis_lutea.AAC.2